ncbi:MAG: hypothetical protein ACM37W_17415 [Actinomycetota bacterium]
MKTSQLAKELELPLVETKALLSDLGLDPDATEIDDEIAQVMIDTRKGVAVKSHQLEPEAPQHPKARKKGGKLAKATADNLTQTVSGSHIQGNQIVRTLILRRMMANVAIADLVSRAGEAAFLARIQQNEQQFTANFINAQDAQLKDTIQQVDGEIEGMLKDLGVALPNESLAKSQDITPDKSILEDLAAIHPDNWLVYNAN